MDLTDEWGEGATGDRPVPEGGYGPPSGPWAPFDRPQSAPPASGPPAPADRGGYMPSGRRSRAPGPERRPPRGDPYGDGPDPRGPDRRAPPRRDPHRGDPPGRP